MTHQVVLLECHCNSHTSKPSVFNRLLAAPVSNSAKRRRSLKKKSFSDVEYPEVTLNMVGQCTTPSKYKGKQPVICSTESDDEPSSGLKKILSESEGVYQHTCIWTGTVALVNYSTLARGIKVNEAHAAIAESQASNSSTEKDAFAYMAGTPEEVAKQFKEQDQVQRNISIRFELRKNISTPLSRCKYSYLRRRKRVQRLRGKEGGRKLFF